MVALVYHNPALPGASGRSGRRFPSFAPMADAVACIDLLLAPSGEGRLFGQPAALLSTIGHDNLGRCTADDLEIIAASLALMHCTFGSPDSIEGMKRLRKALVPRPEALATIAAWLAYTPYIGPLKDKKGRDTRAAEEHREWSFELEYGPIDFKRPEASDAPRLSPEQSSEPYFKAILGPVAMILMAAPDKELRPLVRQHFVGSKHFEPAMLRLVALAGRWNAEAYKPEEQLGNQIALTARDAIGALCAHHKPCVDLIDRAKHPFLKSIEARGMLEAIPRAANAPRATCLPPKGARHVDDPMTLRDYAKFAAFTAVLLGAIYLIGLGVVRYVWPAVWWCVRLPWWLARGAYDAVGAAVVDVARRVMN